MCELSSPAEAAILSACCRYSLATAEVILSPADTFFALTEQQHPAVWRWAVYGTQKTALAEGAAPTRAAAGEAAVASLVRWEVNNELSA